MAEKAKQLKIDDIETPKDSAKEKALADALKTIEKAYGKGSIMKLGDANQEKIEVIPSGSIALDIALGVGGYPKGRIIEVFGPESSGKTTFALHAIAEAQKMCIRDRLYVDINNTRKGIGKSLLSFALDKVKPNVSIEVLKGNLPAIFLYSSMGFKITETLSGKMPGNEHFLVTVHIMKR